MPTSPLPAADPLPPDRHRPLRWYEWLACLLLMWAAANARGSELFRCDDAHGGTRFQDQPCAVGDKAQRRANPPAPPAAPSPQYAVRDDRAPLRASTRAAAPSRNRAEPALHSFECRSADGQVFYRHDACPKSVDAKDNHLGHAASGKPQGKQVAVHAVRVSRDDACREMQRAGAIGRVGHANDERIASYDKNLGRDPCH